MNKRKILTILLRAVYGIKQILFIYLFYIYNNIWTPIGFWCIWDSKNTGPLLDNKETSPIKQTRTHTILLILTFLFIINSLDYVMLSFY